jgi:hypothetical protein
MPAVSNAAPVTTCAGASTHANSAPTVEAIERRGHAPRLLARQPVAREARDDASADQHDERQNRGDPKPFAMIDGAPARGLVMKERVGE